MKIDAGLTYYDEINKKIRAAKDCEIEVDNCLGQRYIPMDGVTAVDYQGKMWL